MIEGPFRFGRHFRIFSLAGTALEERKGGNRMVQGQVNTVDVTALPIQARGFFGESFLPYVVEHCRGVGELFRVLDVSD